jgi:hypothetical protein
MNCLRPWNGTDSRAVARFLQHISKEKEIFRPSSPASSFRRVYIREVLRKDCLNMRKK